MAQPRRANYPKCFLMKHWPFPLHDLWPFSNSRKFSTICSLDIIPLPHSPFSSFWNSSYWIIDRFLFYSSCLNFPFILFYCILALCCIQAIFFRLVFSAQVLWSCMFNHTLIQCRGFVF